MNSRVNECGPYGTDLAGGGGCLAKFARSHGAKKGCGCGHCGGGMYADPVYGTPYGMDSCCGGGGFDGGMMGGMPGGDCGCGGGGASFAPPQQMIPPTPASQYAPPSSPTPAPIAEPQPEETSAPAPPVPATPAPPMTYQPAPGAPALQNVSVEEFQRLPGTIINGPTTSTAPAPAAVPTTMMTRPAVPTAAQPGVRPANWQPTRTY